MPTEPRGDGELLVDAIVAVRVGAAEAGDSEAAKWLLEEFIATVDQATAAGATPRMSPALLTYLRGCFAKITVPNGLEDVGRALNLTGKPGRPAVDAFPICAAVVAARELEPGESLNHAMRRAASKLGMSFDAVKNAWRNQAAQGAAMLAAKAAKRG